MKKIDLVSGLRYETPLFGILTIEKNMAKLDQGILYSPKFCLKFSDTYMGLQTPLFEIEYYRKDTRGDIVIKFGRTWHHMLHDLTYRGLGGLVKHIWEEW